MNGGCFGWFIYRQNKMCGVGNEAGIVVLILSMLFI